VVVLNYPGAALRPEDISRPLGSQYEMHGARISNVDTICRLYDTLRYVSDALLDATPIRFKETNFFFSFLNFSILDDMEMYEQQDPFKLTDFISMSYFLNQFLYKAILTYLFGK